MGHSSACASSCAVLVLLGGLLLADTANAQAGGSVSGRWLAVDERRRSGRRPGRAAPRPQPRLPRAAAAAGGGRRHPRRPTPDDAAQAAEWAERDRAVNESNTITGGTGLLHTQHAQSGAPGQFRLGFVAEWFKAGFLCTDKFPCPNPAGGAALTTDSLSHTGGTLSLGASLFNIGAGTFDGYIAISAMANSDSANRPAPAAGPRAIRTSASSTWPPWGTSCTSGSSRSSG